MKQYNHQSKTYFLLLVIGGLLFSCKNETPKTVLLPSDVKVLHYDPNLVKNDTGWMYKGKRFSGYMIEIERDGKLVYQVPIIDGKENGLAKGWYNTGEKLLERMFVNGKKEGLYQQWWPNGYCRYLFNYKTDVYHGTQTVFYPNGKRREVTNYAIGKVEGLQSMWDSTGQLVSNYTIKNGKLYGVKSVESCIPVFH